MSTDRKRLTSAIQRIAREDPEIRELLEDFRNSGGKPSESATSGSGAEDRQICCDGSTGSNPNPGSDTKDTGDGGQDVLDPDDPANLDKMGGECVSGVTDCATGQAVCFCGSDWIPPDGWDGPTDPPFVEGYEPGCYWTGPFVSGKFSSPEQYIAAVSQLNGDEFYVRESQIDGGCSGYYVWDWDSVNTYNPRPNATMASCDPEEGGACDPDLADVKVDAWPEDGCVNLAVKGGSIVGSKFDPENDGSYSAPRDEIELCDGFGNRFLLRGGANNTWKSIKSLNGDIDPDTGAGYLYRANGQRIRQISPSEFRDDTV